MLQSASVELQAEPCLESQFWDVASTEGRFLFIVYITETFVHLTKNWINVTKCDFAAVKLLQLLHQHNLLKLSTE